ncbi:MAG: hypothetical protein U0271_15345 [Polyangiaceae bacterium]
MTYIKDLTRSDYFGPLSAGLIHVGWLHPSAPIPQGDTPVEVFAALMKLLADPWQPVAFAGREPCRFCRFTGGPATVHYEEHSATIGANNLFLPAGAEGVFVCPSTIAHYIDAHGYGPPPAFQAAVLEWAAAPRITYLRELKRAGLVKTAITS